MLRRLRRRLNLSQVDLATLLGCSGYLICKWEFGEFKPSTEKFIRLLRLADVEERAIILKSLESRGVAASDLSMVAGRRPPGDSAQFEDPQVSIDGCVASSSTLAGPAPAAAGAAPALPESEGA